MNYILASASPRRRELLAKCGIYFDIIPSGIEEKITGEAPPDIVMELARQQRQWMSGKIMPRMAM